MQCFYYWVLQPPARQITDKGGRSSTFEVRIKFRDQNYKVALFSDVDCRPEFVRLTIPGLDEERIPDDLLPFIQSVREHMLTKLRLATMKISGCFLFIFGISSREGHTPTTDMEIELNLRPTLNPELLRNLFTSSLNHREEFRLFNNGTNEGIPAQYRFLSLYKLLEMRFKKQGQWQQGFSELIEAFRVEFEQKQLSGDPISLIHGLRDKCAHIRTGSKRELLGVSELNHKQLVTVLKVLPIMIEMGAKILGDLTENRVAIRPAVGWQPVPQNRRNPRNPRLN